MQNAQQSLGVSERRACRVLGQRRSTQQYRAKVPADETALVERMSQLATQYGRYGYRRITALLQGEGWRVNHKRIERLWRREGLKVPHKQPKRGRLWLNDGSCVRLRPERKDHVWAYDFVHERTHDGKSLRLLTNRLKDQQHPHVDVIDALRYGFAMRFGRDPKPKILLVR